jgi:hypothetical protein
VRACVLIVAALALAVGCGTKRNASFHDASSGIAFRYPAGWSVTGFSHTISPQRLAVASYRVTQRQVEGDCGGEKALAALPARGAAVLLFDYGPVPATRDFPRRPRQFLLRQGRFGDYECFGRSYLFRFHTAGHNVQAQVALGRLADATMRARTLAVLDSLGHS